MTSDGSIVLKRFAVTGYKAFDRRCEVELRPLTILVGRNSAGKSALARVVPMMAGALMSRDAEVLPLSSLGLRHGTTLEDIVTDRRPHGLVELALQWDDAGVPIELEVSLRVTLNVPGGPSHGVVERWRLARGSDVLVVENNKADGIAWQGLWPGSGIAPWTTAIQPLLGRWARGVRYLRSPRRMSPGFFALGGGPPEHMADGSHAPRELAARRELARAVGTTCERMFGAELIVEQAGPAGSLKLRRRGQAAIALEHAGQGVSQALPVLTLLKGRGSAGPGVDIIEHPEVELHPAAHTDIANLVIDHSEESRPLLIETHSEIVLLRIRRRIAEGRLLPDTVAVYWIDQDEKGHAHVSRIGIGADGGVENWPEGVFYEDYEEVLAIRRAARGRDAD